MYVAYCLSTEPTISGSSTNWTSSSNVSVPTTTNSWGLGESTWSNTPPTPTAGRYLFMSQGVYNGFSTTTFTPPFWASLKVGQLSAISANMGSITSGSVTLTGSEDYIRSGKTYNGDTTAGFWLSGGSDPEFSVGNATHGITWDSTAGTMTVNGEIIGAENIQGGAVSSRYYYNSDNSGPDGVYDHNIYILNVDSSGNPIPNSTITGICCGAVTSRSTSDVFILSLRNLVRIEYPNYTPGLVTLGVSIDPFY